MSVIPLTANTGVRVSRMERDLGLRLATEEVTRKLFPASGDAHEVGSSFLASFLVRDMLCCARCLCCARSAAGYPPCQQTCRRLAFVQRPASWS